MKRILMGTSALSVLAIAGAVSAQAQTRTCDIQNNVYVCEGADASSGSIRMDLSSASNPALFLFQGDNVGDAQSITTGSAADVVTVQGAGTDADGFPQVSGSIRGLTLNMEGGDDQVMVSGSDEGNVGSMTNVSIDTGVGNDYMNVSGSIISDGTASIAMGEGNDRVDVSNTGNLNENLDMGSGDDTLVNSGIVFANVSTGTGNDLVQTASSFTGLIDLGAGDDTLRAINVAPQNAQTTLASANSVVMDGGAGFDRLELQGTTLGSNLNLTQVANFETLVKSGTGTWSVRQSTDAGADQFTDGVHINEGTLNFNGSERVELDTYIVNNGVLGGELKLNSTAHYDANDANSQIPLHNTSNGQIAANIQFSEFNDLFVNDGRINDKRSDDATLDVVIDMGDGSDEFRNSGTVSGQITLGSGEDRFALASSDLFLVPPPGTVDGGSGFDTIELAGAGGRLMEINCSSCAITNFENLDTTSGEWRFSADQDFNGEINVTGGILDLNTAITSKSLIIDGGYVRLPGSMTALNTTVNSGTLEILNGLLTSPVIVNQQGSLKGNGTIKGATTVHGNITPAEFTGDSDVAIGTLEIEGNFDVSDTGKVTINVDPENNEWDKFDVSGFVTIDDGALIEVVPTSELADGQFFEIDIANAGLIEGNFTVDPNSQFTDYSISYDEAGKIILTMGASAAPVTFQAAAASGNGVIYNHITGDASLSSAWAGVGGFLGAASDSDLDEISPEFYDAVYGLSRSYARNFGAAMAKRIGDKEWCGTMQGSGEADCRAHRADGGDVWGSIEMYSHNNSNNAVSETEGSVIAGMIGGDSRMGLATFGLAAGFGMLGQDVNNSGSAEGFGASFGGYFSIPMEVINLDGDISYSMARSDVERLINVSTDSFDSTMASEVTSHNVNAGLRLTQEYKNQSGLEFQPTVGIRINRQVKPGFTETTSNFGDLALVVDDSTHTDVTGELGIAVRRAFGGEGGSVFIPELRASVSRVLAGQEVETTARFVGSTASSQDFTITTEQSQMQFGIGGGINYRAGNGATVFADYDYEGGDGQIEHQGSLGVRYDF